MSVKKLVCQLREKKKRNEKIPELRVEVVDNIIKSYFDHYEQGRGSHIIVQDHRLKKYSEINYLSEYGPNGQLTIPVSGGQKVKRIYVEKILLAIEICEIMEEKSGQEN